MGDASCLWHAADAGRVLHHPPALGHGKLAEQKKTLPRRGGNPIGIAAAGIEERRLRGARRLLSETDQLILDLERAEGFEFTQREDVGHDLLLVWRLPWFSAHNGDARGARCDAGQGHSCQHGFVQLSLWPPKSSV